jgi:hypothetical protein
MLTSLVAENASGQRPRQRLAQVHDVGRGPETDALRISWPVIQRKQNARARQ